MAPKGAEHHWSERVLVNFLTRVRGLVERGVLDREAVGQRFEVQCQQVSVALRRPRSLAGRSLFCDRNSSISGSRLKYLLCNAVYRRLPMLCPPFFIHPKPEPGGQLGAGAPMEQWAIRAALQVRGADRP
jgi:hypothetical protein